MKLPILGNGMKLGTGLAIGAVAVILAPVVLPVIGGVLKSLSKSAIKGGLIMYEKGKVAVAEARETLEDLTAEAKAEMAEEEPALPAPKKKAAAAAK